MILYFYLILNCNKTATLPVVQVCFSVHFFIGATKDPNFLCRSPYCVKTTTEFLCLDKRSKNSLSISYFFCQKKNQCCRTVGGGSSYRTLIRTLIGTLTEAPGLCRLCTAYRACKKVINIIEMQLPSGARQKISNF